MSIRLFGTRKKALDSLAQHTSSREAKSQKCRRTCDKGKLAKVVEPYCTILTSLSGILTRGISGNQCMEAYLLSCCHRSKINSDTVSDLLRHDVERSIAS